MVKAAQSLDDKDASEAVALFDGMRYDSSLISAGTAFTKGEQGWRGDTLYESLINANVWTPEQYPAGWVLIN